MAQYVIKARRLHRANRQPRQTVRRANPACEYARRTPIPKLHLESWLRLLVGLFRSHVWRAAC